MPAARKKRVAVLGGGMAGLSAAWALSDADARDELDVCVFERAPYLGGKGASTRGVHGRIEEHGLHVWLGYYDNAFRLIREVYDELDRPSTDPGCPLSTWRDAFAPADLVGVEDRGGGGGWSHWVATFGRNGAEPGTRSDAGRQLSAATFVRRGLALLLDFSSSIGRRGRSPSVTLSGSAEPPPASGPAALGDLTEILRRAEIAALVGAMESIRLLEAAIPRGGSLATLVLGYLDRMRGDLVDRLHRDDGARRSAELADIVISAMQGTIRDGLLTDASGFAAIDELDFRDWLARHGARPETLDCSLIRGMYDLVFAYEDGDPERPRFPAGLGLFLAGKFFFEYSGSIFWRMQAGMGDVVFAPLYQALLRAGCALRAWSSRRAARAEPRSFASRACGPHRAPGRARSARAREGAAVLPVAVRLRRWPAVRAERLRRRGSRHVARRRARAVRGAARGLSGVAGDGWWPPHGADAVPAGVAARGRGGARLALSGSHRQRLSSPPSTPTPR